MLMILLLTVLLMLHHLMTQAPGYHEQRGGIMPEYHQPPSHQHHAPAVGHAPPAAGHRPDIPIIPGQAPPGYHDKRRRLEQFLLANFNRTERCPGLDPDLDCVAVFEGGSYHFHFKIHAVISFLSLVTPAFKASKPIGI